MKREVYICRHAGREKLGASQSDGAAGESRGHSFILAWVIYEQSAESSNYIASMVDLDAAFEFGLTVLVSGLHQQLAAR